jgi:hypothetical protein
MEGHKRLSYFGSPPNKRRHFQKKKNWSFYDVTEYQCVPHDKVTKLKQIARRNISCLQKSAVPGWNERLLACQVKTVINMNILVVQSPRNVSVAACTPTGIKSTLVAICTTCMLSIFFVWFLRQSVSIQRFEPRTSRIQIETSLLSHVLSYIILYHISNYMCGLSALIIICSILFVGKARRKDTARKTKK